MHNYNPYVLQVVNLQVHKDVKPLGKHLLMVLGLMSVLEET